MRDPAAHAERGAEASLMKHKTLTGEDRRGAGPTAACQQILRAPQENAAEGACKDRKKAVSQLELPAAETGLIQTPDPPSSPHSICTFFLI